MSDKLRNMKIAQSRIDKLRFILQIKNDKSLQVTDKTIKAIEQEITVDLYNKIIKDHQLFFIIVILSHSEYSGYIFTNNNKKTEFFDDIEKILFGRKINNYGSNYDIKMDYETEGYNKNIHALNLIMKILIKNLEITDHMISEILALDPFDNDSGESLLNFSVNSESDVSKKSLSNDKKYIVIRILLSIYLNEPNQSDLYERVQTIILNSDKKFIETITATAEQYTVQELEIAIGIFNEKLQQKKREASITGGKKKTKYSIFMSKELKRLKKKNPDKDYKLRFKEAVNNWKNKK
jgi:hypothetical protein